MLNEAECDLPFTRDSVLADSRLSLFQKVLLLSDGSVTELLCIYTGKQIRARKIEQSVSIGQAPSVLRITEDKSLLHRKIMLADRSTNYIYADSVFVLDHLSKWTRKLLFDTDAPVGLLWKDEKSGIYREIVDLRIKQNAGVAAHFDLPSNTPMLSRTCLIWQCGRSLGIISEEFPTTSFRS